MKKRQIALHVVIGIVLLAIGFFLGQYALRYIYIVPPSLRPPVVKPEIKDVTLEKEGFSIIVPAGWKEVTAMQGVSATIANISEEITDPALKKINFRTNYSITYDNLKNKTKKDYVAGFKTTLKQVMPGILFLTEKDLVVNGNDGYVIEASLNQRGADINVLIILAKGKNQDIWTVAFNTGKANWEKYKDGFYQIAQSFTVK